MVRTALIAVLAASLALPPVLATPVGVVATARLQKVRTVASARALLAKDRRRFAAGSSGAATNDVDHYVAEVSVGGRAFRLVVDTGSSDTWVDAGAAVLAGLAGQSTGNSISVSFGSSNIACIDYTSTVSFAGLTVDSQPVGAAIADVFGYQPVDGVLGLGWPEVSAPGSATTPAFLDNLYRQGAILADVLGVYFRPERGSDTTDANGELTLGGVDPTKYAGALTWAPRLTDYAFSPHWDIAVASLYYGAAAVLGSYSALVDTGTTLIYLPRAGYQAFLSAAGGQTDLLSGLASFATAPTRNLVFTVAGTAFALTPAQYLVPAAEYGALALSSGSYYAWVGDGGAAFVLGQKFLENYYSVFDTTNARVGFATRT